MNEIKDDDKADLFPAHKKTNLAPLTQNEVTDLVRLADNYGLSGKGKIKLLLALRARKKAAAHQNTKDVTP